MMDIYDDESVDDTREVSPARRGQQMAPSFLRATWLWKSLIESVCVVCSHVGADAGYLAGERACVRRNFVRNVPLASEQTPRQTEACSLTRGEEKRERYARMSKLATTSSSKMMSNSKKSCIPYLSSLRCDQVLEPFVRAGIVSFQPSRIRHSGASTAAAATTGTPRQYPSDASASTNATATAEALLAPVTECVGRYFEMHRQGDPLAPTWVVLVDADEFLGGGQWRRRRRKWV